jgi:hypothetical protein
MRLVKWVFVLLFWLVLAGFLHYTLPQKDIVRVQGTEIIRQDFSGANRIFYAQADSSSAENTVNRDLRLINTTRENGRVQVYRNEDTGFGWPPYFKLDSSNLQAEAQGAVSSKAEPEWYLMTHYGWRNEWLTIYPNAISLKPISGPEVGKPIPWVNITILVLLAAVFWGVYVRWRRFRMARIDPTLEAMGDDLAETRAGMSRWLGTWRRKN